MARTAQSITAGRTRTALPIPALRYRTRQPVLYIPARLRQGKSPPSLPSVPSSSSDSVRSLPCVPHVILAAFRPETCSGIRGPLLLVDGTRAELMRLWRALGRPRPSTRRRCDAQLVRAAAASSTLRCPCQANTASSTSRCPAFPPVVDEAQPPAIDRTSSPLRTLAPLAP